MLDGLAMQAYKLPGHGDHGPAKMRGQSGGRLARRSALSVYSVAALVVLGAMLSAMASEFWRAPVERFSDGSGELALGSPAPGLLCTRATGRASPAMAEYFVEAGKKVVAKAGWIEGFHDWSGLVGYAPECRRILTEWNVGHRDQIKRGHLFVTQKLVRMGVTVVSIAVRHLESHGSRASLVAAYEKALADAR